MRACRRRTSTSIRVASCETIPYPGSWSGREVARGSAAAPSAGGSEAPGRPAYLRVETEMSAGATQGGGKSLEQETGVIGLGARLERETASSTPRGLSSFQGPRGVDLPELGTP